jgi:hypothetical protein
MSDAKPLYIIKNDDGYWLVIRNGHKDAMILLETRSPMVLSIIEDRALMQPDPREAAIAELVRAAENMLACTDKLRITVSDATTLPYLGARQMLRAALAAVGGGDATQK